MSRLAPTTIEVISSGSIWHRNTKFADTISPLHATCATRYSHPANLQAILRPIQST